MVDSFRAADYDWKSEPKAKGFSHEHTVEILLLLQPLTPELCEYAVQILGTMHTKLFKANWTDRCMPDFDKHRERIASIVAAAKRLESLLADEPLSSNALVVWSHAQELLNPNISTVESDEFWSQHDQLLMMASRFNGTLRDIQANGTRLLDRPEWLRQWRSETGNRPEHKAPVRIAIWEPMFDLWQQCGRAIGTSRSGELQNVIAIAHRCLGEDAPKAESLYKAIKDFKRKQTPK